MFLRATSPLSPTSTLCIPIFCGGRPESDNHFCKAEAFSNESTSQPQGIFEFTLDIEVLAVEIEQRIGHLRNVVWAKEGGVLCSGEGVREKLGMRAKCKILEASAMVVNGWKALVLKRKPYLLLWAPVWPWSFWRLPLGTMINSLRTHCFSIFPVERRRLLKCPEPV